jgi:Protein of unknown function (DUF4245)
MRDLIGSMVILLVIVAAVVGFGKGCSFSPAGPTIDPTSAPTADAARELAAAASSVDFPVRRPALPAGWRANSTSTGSVGTGSSVIVRVGWLTPLGGFVQLSQSGGAPLDVLTAETDRPGVGKTGSVEVAGTSWATYPGRRDEQAWVATLGRTTLVITGTAGQDEFRVLAETVQKAAPLPSRVP